MSEPHELEERVAKVHHAAGCYAHEWDGCEMKDKFRATARAVLNLVRQEQETTESIPGVAWSPRNRRGFKDGIRAWWLSHTAKETSNG